MQKKLALLEPHHHSEVLRTFAQLFLHLGWELHIFTNAQVQEDCYTLAEGDGIQWYIQGEEKTIRFFQQQKPQIDECQLAIFVTLVSDFSFFSQFRLKPKTILVIHNGNTFFDPSANWSWASSVSGTLKDFGRLLLAFMKQEHKHRRELLTSFDYLSMAGSTMSRYFAERESQVAEFSFVKPLPFVFYEGNPKESLPENKALEIAIPGVVKGEGKDYEKVWRAFGEVVPQLDQPIRLNFLGSAQSKYAQQLIHRFEQLENEFFKIQYSRELINQKDFDQQLRQADFLVLPLKESYRLGSIREIYGHTNISGGINDMIRFGIPALISPYYPLDSPLREMTHVYDSTQDLIDLLLDWIKKRSFESIRRESPKLLAPYHKENLALEVGEWLNEIL